MQYSTLVLGPLETNCYLVWDETTKAAAVIDPAAAPDRISDALQSRGLTLRLILLTHNHFDHIGALKALAERFRVPVYVHPADTAEHGGMSYGRLVYTDTYEDGSAVTLDGLSFTVLSTPGHTPGSVCLVCEHVIFSGDTLFAGACGRTDFEGGSTQDLLDSLRRLSRLEGDYDVLPGHGEPTTLDLERRWNPYMR